jgi:hypothetical protein
MALLPHSFAAKARAAPWFPEECVTTVETCRGSCKIAFIAPRSLNDPVRWKFSHLKNNSAPTASFSEFDDMTEVR